MLLYMLDFNVNNWWANKIRVVTNHFEYACIRIILLVLIAVDLIMFFFANRIFYEHEI